MSALEILKANGLSACGVAMDSTSNVVTLAANSSGAKPVGLLLTEFVDLDLTRQPVNWHKNQSNIGEKASIMTKGWVTTDQIYGTPTAGQWAVLSSSGTITGVDQFDVSIDYTARPRVGTFRTSVDEAGFASVYIDL